jgi:nucleotide-binding universal stress UspA family protein
VNDPETSLRIRRILVALDASPHSLAALDAAVDLAARMEVELAGLFVEDVELLRIADSPSAREVVYTAASEAPLNRAVMERKLRAQSSQLRKALAAAAHRAQVRWSFQTVRGHVTPALREAAGRNDIVALGRLGWSFGRRMRIGSTALELATSSIPLLLISQRSVIDHRRLLVYYDGSHASREAVLVTAKLARSGKQGVTVLLGAADYENNAAAVPSLIRDHTLDVRCRRVDLRERTELLTALREERAGMLVLAGRRPLKDKDALGMLLQEIDVPLLLLGEGLKREQTPRSTG